VVVREQEQDIRALPGVKQGAEQGEEGQKTHGRWIREPGGGLARRRWPETPPEVGTCSL
jgi:hypothetical protein